MTQPKPSDSAMAAEQEIYYQFADWSTMRSRGETPPLPSEMKAIVTAIIDKYKTPAEKAAPALLESCCTIATKLSWLLHGDTPPEGWDWIDASKSIFAHTRAGVAAVILQKKAAIAETEGKESIYDTDKTHTGEARHKMG